MIIPPLGCLPNSNSTSQTHPDIFGINVFDSPNAAVQGWVHGYPKKKKKKFHKLQMEGTLEVCNPLSHPYLTLSSLYNLPKRHHWGAHYFWHYPILCLASVQPSGSPPTPWRPLHTWRQNCWLLIPPLYWCHCLSAYLHVWVKGGPLWPEALLY